MITPGPQKPHCSEPLSSKAFWIGCSRSRVASPSMVGHAAAVGLAGQHQAGVDRLAVDDHGAGAAVADVAAELGAGQIEMLAQQLQQRRFRRHRRAAVLAVDDDRHVGHWASSLRFRLGPRVARLPARAS